ncbi:MAG: thermosome subunit, partial [bacterium]|nr:thermosome subunit [bacterium]
MVIVGVPNNNQTCSILVRGSNVLLVDETERSLRDALCVVRSIVKKRSILPGGGAPEIEVATRMNEISNKVTG